MTSCKWRISGNGSESKLCLEIVLSTIIITMRMANNKMIKSKGIKIARMVTDTNMYRQNTWCGDHRVKTILHLALKCCTVFCAWRVFQLGRYHSGFLFNQEKQFAHTSRTLTKAGGGSDCQLQIKALKCWDSFGKGGFGTQACNLSFCQLYKRV